MDIKLRNLVPRPLKDRFILRSSGIWNSEVDLRHKEWVKVKAPSGTGKTTLVHVLFKMRHDYEGMVYYGDRDLRTIPAGDIATIRQKQVSIIFQDLRLFENLTARENIDLKRVMQTAIYPPEVIDDMAERLGIQGILNQPAGICSYGEQQRIAIVRALMQPFEWLIMDEPFSHLDKDNTRKAAALIAEECKKRNAGFLVTDLEDDDNFDYTRHYDL
ncbi:ATP-binding cassette domain-containing protein [Segetibacter sp. 3557_3]|uniref:ATP-binding cassette domain-containing protein n=1 Tax=Segetibacter sp. 3557_3 TaxID=2547429 RepID=UPI0010584384|nr:ATP-binding cassette domain-containing protein [Segetibacter sp. 3557_3]TDH24073.1 ATP-binding cassette domain-containing protein [Segetibacter sp. 3557_3]